MKRLLMSIVAIILVTSLNAQRKQDNNDTIPKGWNFGVLPAVAYDADLGFKYGGLFNIFNYKDGLRYPDYYNMFKVEASYTTKGSGIFQFFYDDKSTLPNSIRFTTDISYLPDQGVDFYGFNGVQAKYNKAFIDMYDSLYMSRMFYKHKRNIFRFTLDFQQNIKNTDFKWLAGIGIWHFKMNTVDIERLNKRKDDDKKLPEIDLLYDTYRKWDIINSREAEGGLCPYLKFGLMYDTRDMEANPSEGMFSEVLLQVSPDLSKHTDKMSFARIALIHRQYFSIVPNKLTAAYRVGYQGTVLGKVPYYMQPIMLNSFSPVVIAEGLGGAKTIRGVLRNRVVGDHIAYGNVELRWKFLDFKLWKQNFYLTLAPFIDCGTVLGKMKKEEINKVINQLQLPVDEREEAFKGILKGDGTFVQYNIEDFFNTSKPNDKLHAGYGAGLYLSMNHNFVLAINYGRAFDKNDGTGGLYINIGFLF